MTPLQYVLKYPLTKISLGESWLSEPTVNIYVQVQINIRSYLLGEGF